MCGILGICMGHYDRDEDNCDAAQDIHEAMYLLQHRGQDACGIATSSYGGRIFMNKDSGMAATVFKDGKRVIDLPGWMGIGHLRYPTWGSSGRAEAQPFYVNSPYGICLSHNGNLTNAAELRAFLDKDAHRHINTSSDSELMLSVFANELNETGKARINETDLFSALERTYKRIQGAWASVIMVAGYGVVAFRDPDGIRPLVWGSRKSTPNPDDDAYDYMVASESIALRQLGFKNITDVLPGQAVLFKKGCPPVFHQIQEPASYSPDIFEYVYFARPDSVIDGISVHESRNRQGIKLADNIIARLGEEAVKDIDVVIPIPETSNTAAAALAERLRKPYSMGFVKNRYVFRTFIMPGQQMRQKSVRRKLSTIDSEFKGKTVLLVDDSVVRGTTSREIVTMAREAGARKVIFSSCSPEVIHPHVHGIDLASQKDLIAHGRTNAEIAQQIGADDIIYQTVEDLVASCAELSPRDPKTQTFEIGVFSGCYVTPVSEAYLEQLDDARNSGRKRKALVASSGPVNTGPADSAETPAAKIAKTNGLAARTRADPQSPGNPADIGIHNAAHEGGN
ncbi:amidophosphoribosyltransferase [Colletotrichum paranaense]|uniref:Amidophosphoribosyltransferase n=2 Tax=Colletotrichum acutatum species complex TaxID=2707335 RepID=A0ABQ9PMX4_9PEZI|nr:amidophosphoribosyltransferase [Colletotrichum paranaense]KAK0372867.1 amidophosphoribosyltransferase [Colletotrichum limetticola]KAK1542897.1 amidophosphoribosyltransferase [Colletotrichum paranaense]